MFVNTYQYRYYHTKQYHGSNGHIKAKVLFLHPDIAGQTPQPVQLIAHKVEYNTCNNYQQAYKDNEFSGLLHLLLLFAGFFVLGMKFILIPLCRIIMDIVDRKSVV